MKERLAKVPVLGTVIRVQERYTNDAADNFAASIGFFGFLSLFPLILIGLSALGFVVRGDIDLQARIVEAVSDAVPGLTDVLGEGALQQAVEDIGDNAGSLLSVATVGLLFTGLKVIAGAQRALAVVFRMELPTGVGARVQQLLALVVLGILALAGSAAGGSVGLDFGDDARALVMSLGLTLVAFLFDLVLFLVAYRVLSPDPSEPAWSMLLPGALLSATAWVALKAGGATLVAGGGDGNSIYGSLASAVTLLLLLYLAGRVFMYGAELAAVLGGVDVPEIGDEDGADDQDEGPVLVRERTPTAASIAAFLATGVAAGVVQRALAREPAPSEDA